MPHAIITQTRGDAHRLAEWIEYHSAIGFDEFHVLLDGVIDDSPQILRSLDIPGRVETYEYPEEGEYFDGLGVKERLQRVQDWRELHRDELADLPYAATDPQSMRQFRRIREILPRIVGHRRGWLAHIDCDEFINIPTCASTQSLTSPAESAGPHE